MLLCNILAHGTLMRQQRPTYLHSAGKSCVQTREFSNAVVMLQVNDTAEQQNQTQLQRAVVTERLAGLHARQEHLRTALEQAVAAAAAAAVAAEPGSAANKPSAADSYAAAAQRKAAAKAAAAVLVEDDAFDAELNVGKGARRGAAAATGFVETERDRLIRTVRICMM